MLCLRSDANGLGCGLHHMHLWTSYLEIEGVSQKESEETDAHRKLTPRLSPDNHCFDVRARTKLDSEWWKLRKDILFPGQHKLINGHDIRNIITTEIFLKPSLTGYQYTVVHKFISGARQFLRCSNLWHYCLTVQNHIVHWWLVLRLATTILHVHTYLVL